MCMNKEKTSYLSFCIGILFVVFLIQTGGSIKGNTIVFPGIKEIGCKIIELLNDRKTYLFFYTTFLHILQSLLFSMSIGIIIGLLEGIRPWIHSFFQPLMILIRSIPMIILVIICMTLFSYKFVPVISTSIILIPLISEATYEGVRSIDQGFIDVYRINGGMTFHVIWHVYLPLMSGYIRQAFIQGCGTCLKIVVSAEYLVQAKNSLGKAVYSSNYFNEYAEIYAYAIMMIILVLLITEIPKFVRLINIFFRKKLNRITSDTVRFQ